MPHLLFRNVAAEEVAKVSAECNEDLANLFACDVSDLTYELIHSTSFIGGKKNSGDKTVEIIMFERSLEARQKIVDVLHAVLSNEYYGYVTIIFNIKAKDTYFENGEHFAKS